MSIEAGNLIAGKFRLERPLAKGGMGSVWVAFNTQLEVHVAVKFMDPQLVQSPELVARFEREAKASAQLHHPYVVQIFEHGVDRGVPFIAMELLEGEDLIARLRARGRLSIPETARILGDVCKALRKAHEKGIVHRDLKPANIFLSRHDDMEVVKVLDFGIAKAMNPTTADGPTKTGALVGSPHYMAPEQARKTNKQVDHRSDLWALGVIAFRCFTGQLPFAGDDIIDVLVRVCTTTTPPTPSSIGVNLGSDVDAFFTKALAREPENRFQSAKEMADALSRLAGVEPQMGLDRSWSDPSGLSRRASDPGDLGGAPARARTEDPRASMPAPKVILSEPAPRPSGPPVSAVPVASSPVAPSPVASWPVGAPASGPYRPPSSSSLPAQRAPTSNPPVPSGGAIPPPRASQPSGPAPVAAGVSPLRSTLRMDDPDDGAQTVPIHASASAMAVVAAASKKAPEPTTWQPSAQKMGATTMPLAGIVPARPPKSHAADSPTMVTVAGTDPAAVAAAISRAGDSTKAEGTLTGAGTELSSRTGRKDSPWVIIAAVVAVVIVVGVIGGVVMLGAQAGSGSEEGTTMTLWTTTNVVVKEDEKPAETTTTTLGSDTATGSAAPTAVVTTTPTASAAGMAAPTAIGVVTATSTAVIPPPPVTATAPPTGTPPKPPPPKPTGTATSTPQYKPVKSLD